MKRGAIAILAAILLVSTTSALFAQDMEEKQDPNEYTQEDSHPLRLMSYLAAPVGFILEWGLARPLHYLATKTPLAPALDSEYVAENGPTPIEELPPVTEVVPEESAGPAPVAPLAAPAAVPRRPTAPQYPRAPLPPSQSSGQPVLH